MKKQVVGSIRGESNMVCSSGTFMFLERSTLVYVPLERVESKLTIPFWRKSGEFATFIIPP